MGEGALESVGEGLRILMPAQGPSPAYQAQVEHCMHCRLAAQ